MSDKPTVEQQLADEGPQPKRQDPPWWQVHRWWEITRAGRKVDWYSLFTQLITTILMGHAFGWFGGLSTACIWMLVNWWRYEDDRGQ